MSEYDTEQLDRLEPAYLANYGLAKSPFSNLHDDAFLYLDAERAQRLNLLQHMTQYSNLLLIVQGERGVGKTSLLTRFIKNAANNWEICEVTANTLVDAGLLLFQIAQGFGLEQLPHDSGELQEMLYAQVAKFHHQDEIPILIIDDAHELAKDALLAIFHLADAQVGDVNLIRIILFAEPQIDKILNARDFRPLRERVTHTMSIPPLDEDTTAEYLKHRMAVAGFNGGSPFTPRMVKRIYKASGGIPERINQLAHETLDKGDFGREEVEDIVIAKSSPRKHKNYVMGGIAVLVILLVVIFHNRLFEDKPEQTRSLPIPLAEKAPEVQPQVPTTPATTSAPKPETTVAAEQVPLATDTNSAEKSQVQEKIIPLHSEPAQTPETSNKDAVPVEAVPATQQTTNKLIEPAATVVMPQLRVIDITPNPVLANNEQQTITIRGEGFTPGSRVFVSWDNKNLEIPPARVNLINDKQLQVRLSVGVQPDKWQLHVEDTKHGRSNTLAFMVATAPLQKKQIQERVLAQEPGNFTLQLFGSHDKKNAETFIRQHQLGTQANIFISEHNGKEWFSVIYGVFPDQATATAAIKTLPTSLQKIKPWVRRFDEIQASINASGILKQQQPRTVPKPAPIFTSAVPVHGDVKQYESWIWSQDPRYFTLQLMGAREPGSVKKFLQAHRDLDGHAVYFHTRHDGRDWYAIVFGVYTDKQKAREAIKRLPAILQKDSPWIRSFASIHAELARTE